MSMCRVFSCVVGTGCLLWPVRSLGRTLLACALLHVVLQGQICLLLQVSLDFLLLHFSPLWWTSFLSVSSRRSGGFYLFYCWPHQTACRILGLRLEIETSAAAVEVQRGPNHWTPPPQETPWMWFQNYIYWKTTQNIIVRSVYLSLSCFHNKNLKQQTKGFKANDKL